MTLTEYINQTDPQPNLKVVLNESEYIRQGTIRIKDYYYTFIDIPTIANKFNITGRYIQINDRKPLWAIDEKTGNPRSQSVFHLPETDEPSPEIQLYREFLEVHQKFVADWQTKNPFDCNNPHAHNRKFKEKYTEFIHSVREQYNLTDEDIKFWLTF